MENYGLLLGHRTADEASFNEVFGEREALLRGLKRKRKAGGDGSLRERMAAVRDTILRETLEECGGNRKRAAEKLGIGYTTLRRMLAGED